MQINPYDPEKHIWIIDDAAQQIFKFTHDMKKLVLTLGEKGVVAADEKHFGRPADITFMPDDSILVADGYINARVVKLDRDGKYLTSWGTKGTGPGQFDLVHCVAVDAKGRVYVADRNNHRIQVLDQTGKVLDMWPTSVHRPT